MCLNQRPNKLGLNANIKINIFGHNTRITIVISTFALASLYFELIHFKRFVTYNQRVKQVIIQQFTMNR